MNIAAANATMPLLTIHHKTEYRYDRPVAFGEHRIMLRPRDGHDIRVLSERLDISPQPSSLRRIHDVFGNSVAIADFDIESDRLVFDSTVTVEHYPLENIDLTPDDEAYYYPFFYNQDEFTDLTPSMTPQYSDPDGALAAWARQFLSEGSRTRTLDLLVGMTHGVRQSFGYRKRYERGTQHPLDTLSIGSGTCRDFALFMMEALRRLGIAARFVSGYIFIPGDEAHGYVGGGSTHAWVRAYLPGAGWIEFDPTNGIVGSRDLIRVAVARDPHQAIPLYGTYVGPADAHLGMDVTIHVLSVGEDKKAGK
ncbi:transglutaminase-like putative cysteine protease [Afipia massiliensis]|uniref:Transglutaminase-like putative cysteine protease n=2 Tax=Afipia massiliensis TaxID=211460 RepID=A0A840N9A4_9BRAD|nr:transglutaminase-like putative cysteine protease [Afipia massiliensis]